jgi:CIC family chloride channel protein
VKPRHLQNLHLLAFAVVIGILSAVGAFFFRSLIKIFQDLFWASGSTFDERLIHSPWWLKLLVPTAAGLIAGPVISFLVPEAKGPGVPEVIVSVTRRQSTIRHRVTFLKAMVTSLLIGSGASVGREGPIVQIGASVGSSIAQLFRLSPELRRICLASGAAAGIAATFNAPIAGTFFAVEIILMDINIGHISYIIISSIVASVLSRIFWGGFPTFSVEPFQLFHYWELGIYLLLGLVAGFIAIGFVRLIYAADGLFGRLHIAEWVKPGIGGLLLGLIALRLPYVMGVGYETVNLALAGSLGLEMAAILLFAKIVATSLCIGSGMSGGIFAPSLVLGASLGTVIGFIARQFMPDLSIDPTHYALAGMGAVVAGTTLAPITAILTIFELTYTYQIILPLMVSCIASTIIVRLFFGYSAYEMKLLKQGINIIRGHDVGILRTLRVSDFMSKEFESLHDSTSLTAIAGRIIQAPYPHFVVFNQKGGLAGVLSLSDLKESLDKFEELKDLTIAADLMTREVITVSTEDNLEKALHLFESHRVSFLPVTDWRDSSRVRGILKKDDLLQAYKERILKDQVLSFSSK